MSNTAETNAKEFLGLLPEGCAFNEFGGEKIRGFIFVKGDGEHVDILFYKTGLVTVFDTHNAPYRFSWTHEIPAPLMARILEFKREETK